MPPAVDYFRGAAYFHTGRHDEASLALSQNMKRAGREGYHYQQCLELMSLGSRCAAFPERNSAGGSSRPPGANSKWPAKRLAPCPGHIQSSLLADHFLVLENHPQISDPSLFDGAGTRFVVLSAPGSWNQGVFPSQSSIVVSAPASRSFCSTSSAPILVA